MRSHSGAIRSGPAPSRLHQIIPGFFDIRAFRPGTLVALRPGVDDSERAQGARREDNGRMRASGDRRVVRRAGEGRHLVPGSALRRRARISVISTLAAFAVWLVTAASASAFTAQGSAKQVYVTGLAPNAQMSLLNSSGATVYTQSADSLGGLLFRNVTPGTGYQVRLTSTGETSGPITVHSDAATPWNPSIYNQSIPD